jgi:hypothetical protein
MACAEELVSTPELGAGEQLQHHDNQLEHHHVKQLKLGRLLRRRFGRLRRRGLRGSGQLLLSDGRGVRLGGDEDEWLHAFGRVVHGGVDPRVQLGGQLQRGPDLLPQCHHRDHREGQLSDHGVRLRRSLPGRSWPRCRAALRQRHRVRQRHVRNLGLHPGRWLASNHPPSVRQADRPAGPQLRPDERQRLRLRQRFLSA